jgi:hypothetical protein
MTPTEGQATVDQTRECRDTRSVPDQPDIAPEADGPPDDLDLEDKDHPATDEHEVK